MYSAQAGKSALVVVRDPPPPISPRGEADCQTALRRGLKEYLEQLSTTWIGGRPLAFKLVNAVGGEVEQPPTNKWPAAAITAVSEGTYEPNDLGGSLTSANEVVFGADAGGTPPTPNQRIYALRPSEFTIDLQIELWATDLEERTATIRMLEDDLNPYEEQQGFRLVLPHYHNICASYSSAVSSRYEDEARQKMFKGYVTVKAALTQIRLVRKTLWTRPEQRTIVT